MTLYLVKVTPDLAARIRADPGLLNQVWGRADVVDPDVAALSRRADRLMEDYLDLGRAVDEEPGRFPWLQTALGGDGRTGVEVAFEFGYGNGFLVGPAEAAEIAEGLTREGWAAVSEDGDTIPGAIVEFYAAAGTENRAVIGGVG